MFWYSIINKLQQLIGDRSKIQDHAVLSVFYNLSYFNQLNCNINNENAEKFIFKVSKLPVDWKVTY